jgi:Zn finger protein HypA/HybF involved in hydrogenase expression
MILINGQKVSEVICLSCFRRWTASRPTETRLSDLECPDCHTCGLVIETGETVTAEDLIRLARG